MADLLDTLNERIKSLGSDWSKYAVVASFALYLLGYLTLRFHLTALGVATDLAVLDERYLFTGARFAVYAVSSVPIVVLLGLLLALPLGLAWRLLGRVRRDALAAALLRPPRLAGLGIVFSVAAIQGVMRQCFYVSDLLLAVRLPAEPAWLLNLLHQDGLKALYFSALVGLCALATALLWPLLRVARPGPGLRAARALLGFLVAVMWLLLPVNYGLLIVDKSLARLAAAGQRQALPGETAWLVWEGKDSVTYLLRNADGRRRSLLTLPRSQALPLEVLGFDPIVPTLFDAAGLARRPPFEAAP